MKIKNLFILSIGVAATLLTACSKDNLELGVESAAKISLNSGIDLQTRAIQETQIEAGRNLSLFVTKPAEEALYNNVKLTANGSGSFSHGDMYYPMDGSPVNFYAVHPYTADQNSLGVMTFSVQADQSSDKGYLDSDLLYALKENIGRTTSAIRLEFRHKLSKLEFTIKQEDGSDNLTGLSSLTILGMKPTTTIDLTSGVLGSASGTATDILTNGVKGVEASEATGISAVVVPQTISSGTRLLQITIGDVDYYYTTTSALTFDESKKYTLELTIKQGGIVLNSIIEGWEDNGDTITGEGQAE